MPSSPTVRLLCGFLLTLAAVGVYSRFTLRQVDGLRELQTQIIDRNRRSSLQLLRIQSNLNALAMAMRDMQAGEEPYPIAAYEAQFRRIRTDLEDALRLERELAPVSRPRAQQQMLSGMLENYWETSARIFAIGLAGRETEARRMIGEKLQPAHAAVTGTVARLLVSNNEAEERATAEIQRIYDGVERNIYRFLLAVLVTIIATSLALIYYNRRLFQRLHAVTEQKSTLARKLIEVQESVLHSVARELHDEFGQILTAIGTMLTRAERKAAPADSGLRDQLRDIRDAAQSALERVRTLSQALHPAVLDDHGLEKSVEWHLKNFERQTGIGVSYGREGELPPMQGEAAIHIYRILQEALNNVARHSQSPSVVVRLINRGGVLLLEVEDQGVGLQAGEQQRGLGLIAMRERAELLGARLALLRPAAGGTLIRLDVPVGEEAVRSTDGLAKASH